MIVDAHLDLAHNATDLGRDLTLPLDQLRRSDTHSDIPVVTLPALREGGVGLCFATLWVDPTRFAGPEAAHKAALEQLAVYQRWEEAGLVRILRSQPDLQAHQSRWPQDHIPALVILIEGAECIREPAEVAFWKAQGVRLIGPAWKGTRYSGGTAEPGGLTPLGLELMQAMNEHGLGLDFAHMDEQAFWESLKVFSGPVCATHANPRRFIPTNRHLSDPMLQAIGQRQGVVGVVLFNSFLQAGWRRGQERVGLEAVQKHLEYVAALIGWDKVGIGSDFDGGFGMQENPDGLDQPGDLLKIGDLVPPEHREGVLGGNWIRWLGRVL